MCIEFSANLTHLERLVAVVEVGSEHIYNLQVPLFAISIVQ